MKTMRLLAVCSAMTLAGVPLASAGDEGAFDLEAVGKVVALDKDKMIVRTDDHGHRIAFAIGDGSQIPDGVEVGSHVKLDYHATGSTGQMVDEVVVLGRATAEGTPTQKSKDVARSEKP